MMSLIEKIAAAVTALVLLAPIRVCAEASREIYSDEEIISAINCAFDSEREKLGSESLAEGFISSGMAGESEADWYIVAEAAVGVEDDYAAYAAAAGTVLEERLGHSEDCYLTEIARTSAAIEICGGQSPELTEISLSGAGDNEVIWVAIAQNICGESGSIQDVYERQGADGSYGLGEPSSDITAMALSVLPRDGEAASAALEYLKSDYAQSADDMSTETAAQLIIGLCAQGINPSQSADFTCLNGVRPTDILMSRAIGGGFSHIESGEKNDMATMQAVTALAVLSHFTATGEAVFSADFTLTDVYSAENLCGDGFSDYDFSVLNGLESAQASDLQTLQKLEERAKTLGADGETVQKIEDKLSQSKRVKDEIESLNREISADFYPADELGFSSLGKLSDINERITRYSDKDRELILSADELSAREKTLVRDRRRLITAVSVFAAAVAKAAIIFVKRKRKR